MKFGLTIFFVKKLKFNDLGYRYENLRLYAYSLLLRMMYSDVNSDLVDLKYKVCREWYQCCNE